MKWLILSSLFLNILFTPASLIEDHAIYISVVEINHVPDAEEASIQYKIFKDDLNDAIHHQYQKIFPIDSIQNIHYQQNISDYLNDHFILNINRSRANFYSFTFALEGDAVFIHAVFKSQPEWQQVTIQSDLLLDLFPTQQNMVHLKSGKENRFAKLSQKKQQVDFLF
jgi:hypothetical protein